MACLAANLLFVMDEYSAFVCFSNLVVIDCTLHTSTHANQFGLRHPPFNIIRVIDSTVSHVHRQSWRGHYSPVQMRDTILSFYRFDLSLIRSYCKVFDYLLKKTCPSFWNKLAASSFRSDVFLIEWWFTLFTRSEDTHTHTYSRNLIFTFVTIYAKHTSHFRILHRGHVEIHVCIVLCQSSVCPFAEVFM